MRDLVIIKILKREIDIIIKSKSMIFFLIILPILLFTFLGLIYIKGTVREIPVGILNYSPGELSSTYIRMIESSGNLKISAYYNNISEMKKDMLESKIYAGFIIPDNFEEDVKTGGCSTITVLNNTTNLITGNTILKDATTFTKTFSAGILLKKFKMKGIPENIVLNIVNQVKIDSNPMYNPNYNYLTYLVPGLIPALFQMIVMLTASMIFNSEFNDDKFKELIKTGKGKLFQIYLGKSIPYLIIHICIGFGIIGILFPAFKIYPSGSVINVLIVMISFVCASFFFGVMISVIIKNIQMASEVTLFLNTAAFIFSGFVYPLWAMPLIHRIFSQVMPFTHFMDAFIKMYFMDGLLKNVYSELIKLGIFFVFSLTVSIIFLYLRIRKEKSECSETI